jgi:hypothetical protein
MFGTALNPKVERTSFVGYDTKMKGYHLWNATKRHVKILSNMIFKEQVFPLRKQPLPVASKPTPLPIPELTPVPGHSHTPDVIDISILPDDSDDNDDSNTLPLPLAPPSKTPEPHIPDLPQIKDLPLPNPPALSHTPSLTIPKKEEEEPVLLTERQREKQPECQAAPDLPLKHLAL